MSAINKLMLAGAVGIGLVAGAAPSEAGLLPQFTVNPNSVPAVTPALFSPFQADSVNGASSELVQCLSGGCATATATGFLTFGSFILNSANLNNAVTGLNFGPILGLQGYGLYLTFTLTDHLTSGTVGSGAATFALDSLNFTLRADVNLNDTFTAASGLTPASVGGTTGDDVTIGTGSLVNGAAAFDSSGNPSLNSLENFFLCTGTAGQGIQSSGPAVSNASTAACETFVGSNFFTAPSPFFPLAFDAFNTTGNAADFSHLASNGVIDVNATGIVDFAVPEPASLSLLGAGLLGMAGLLRRRRGRKQAEAV